MMDITSLVGVRCRLLQVTLILQDQRAATRRLSLRMLPPRFHRMHRQTLDGLKWSLGLGQGVATFAPAWLQIPSGMRRALETSGSFGACLASQKRISSIRPHYLRILRERDEGSRPTLHPPRWSHLAQHRRLHIRRKDVASLYLQMLVRRSITRSLASLETWRKLRHVL